MSILEILGMDVMKLANMKPIRLTKSQWHKLKTILINEYQETPSVMLIRSKMKDVLGFTVREHREWIKHENDSIDQLLTVYEIERGGRNQHWVMLDFYSEPMRTLFLLKYSHVIDSSR